MILGFVKVGFTREGLAAEIEESVEGTRQGGWDFKEVCVGFWVEKNGVAASLVLRVY